MAGERPRIFVSAKLPGDAASRLEAVGEVVVAHDDGGVTGHEFTENAASFDAIVAMLTDRIDAALLARATRLRIVANVAVGIDNVDLDACRARGVVVTNTPGVLTDATADLAFGLLLAAARRIAEGDRMIRAGAWTGWTPTLLVAPRVHDASIGIVGFGRIGRAMARRAHGFGMHVFYTQRNSLPPHEDAGARFLSIDDLFAQCDFVSLHCPLTPETRNLASRTRLARMKPGAIFINTARGACVDEAALIDLLESGRIAAAGLDVFDHEPHVPERLRTLPNVVLTPHIGSAEAATRAEMAKIAADNVIAVLDGRAPANSVT